MDRRKRTQRYQTVSDEDTTTLINRSLDTLQEKLLDFSTNNPLISTKLPTIGSGLFVRIIHTTFDRLFKRIVDSQEKMEIISLPPPPPPDQGADQNVKTSSNTMPSLFEGLLLTDERKNVLVWSPKEIIEFQQNKNRIYELPDQEYVSSQAQTSTTQSSTMDQESEKVYDSNQPDQTDPLPKQPNKRIKDGLPFRQEHARNHDISPDFELPIKESSRVSGAGNKIQTLLYPEELDKHLVGINKKKSEWREETGINVLYTVFGFLEWKDKNDKDLFSPLMLLPVELEKVRKKVRKGAKEYERTFFSINGEKTEIQLNETLAEKLQDDFDKFRITLPKYDNQQNLGDYFKKVVKYFQGLAQQTGILIKVRSWAVIGIFPFKGLAMYHDLDPDDDPNRERFVKNPIISSLLLESRKTSYSTTPFGEEYEVDKPDIENTVPYLVMDADASQFSAIVDVMKGKNVAIEGPPGTGKSQTIVNIIAAALAKEKKILFVAEKLAALEIVRSRLNAVKIGDFVLPLQANRSGREQVIHSLKARLDMESSFPAEFKTTFERFKNTREELNTYIQILTSLYGQTDFNIYELLGRRIKLSPKLDKLPREIKRLSVPNPQAVTKEKLQKILTECQSLERAWERVLDCPDYWKIIQSPRMIKTEVDELLMEAKQCAEQCDKADKLRQKLVNFQLLSTQENLKDIIIAIQQTPKTTISDTELNFTEKLLDKEYKVHCDVVHEYLNKTQNWREKEAIIQHYLCLDIDSVDRNALQDIKNIVNKHNLDSLEEKKLHRLTTELKHTLDNLKQVKELYDQALPISDVFTQMNTSQFLSLLKEVGQLSKQELVLRKKELDDPSSQSLLKTQAQTAQLLKNRQDFLEKEFISLSPSSLPDPHIFWSHASAISQAKGWSFFSSIFSKDYRQAKRFYLSISRDKYFHDEKAIKNLRELSKWKFEVDNFCNNEELQELCGVHFDGIHTDFTHLLRVMEFFQKVNEILKGYRYTREKSFFKYTDTDNLVSLPTMDDNHPIHTIGELSLVELEQKMTDIDLDTWVSSIHDLIEKSKTLFRDPQEIQRDQIMKLPTEFESLIETREVLRKDERVRNILGTLFRAEETREQDLKSSLSLANTLKSFQSNDQGAFLFCIREGVLEKLETLITQILEQDNKVGSCLESIAALTKTRPEQWRDHRSFAELSEWMEKASQDRTGLLAYSQFIGVKNDWISGNPSYERLTETILSLGRRDVCDVIEVLIIKNMTDEIYKTHSQLSTYDGRTLDDLRRKFQELDRQCIELSRQDLQAVLSSRAKPPQGKSSGKVTEYTELSLIKHEISKTRRWQSVRELIKRAPKSLLELKPCWMMSPLAVAQYLPKNIKFDLLIIDEASQMTPEHAIGALVRANQVVVVGDTNQLPPTLFFKKVREDDVEQDENEGLREKSILDMANQGLKTKRQLRWHYRSRYKELIAFSNKHIYKNRLVVFPSPREDGSSKRVVSYKKVDGIYSSGTNEKEAKVMVDAMMKFIKEKQDKSLGVVLLNKKQSDLLNTEWERAKHEHLDARYAREYEEKWETENDGLESFFIKNLENVQGDERDMIFIGTVYGPGPEDKRVMQRFGPISGEAGRRRLNVLFSRAKEGITTFSSMIPSDILRDCDSSEVSISGVSMLKAWLEYSMGGKLESGEDTGREPDSDFERHVIEQIEQLGYVAIPQVGVKGYSIDIGIKPKQDWNWNYGFIMGVECDGATYHSSRSARERDRLRQEVLENLGWCIYRIWSTDWYNNPDEEIEKLGRKIKEQYTRLKEGIDS